jgi:hypothetical protein
MPRAAAELKTSRLSPSLINIIVAITREVFVTLCLVELGRSDCLVCLAKVRNDSVRAFHAVAALVVRIGTDD